MNKKDELALKEIADHYGPCLQGLQSIEEMAELTQALLKLFREPPNENERIYDVIEEIADVGIMLKQLTYLYDCKDEVNIMEQIKIARQLERIKDES